MPILKFLCENNLAIREPKDLKAYNFVLFKGFLKILMTSSVNKLF